MALNYSAHFLKDLENMPPQEQANRCVVLIAWAKRYAEGHANPKWLEGHFFELARLCEMLLLGELRHAGPQTVVTQRWTHSLTFMQQTVLLTAVRGPDGVAKYHPCKYLIRWFRRCVLMGALDHNVFETPWQPGGGSFTGPSYKETVEHDWEERMAAVVDDYLKSLDELPHHFQLHLLHAAEIIGYKHPDPRIRDWWEWLYLTLVADMHLSPETEQQLDWRLADNEAQWRSTSSAATQD